MAKRCPCGCDYPPGTPFSKGARGRHIGSRTPIRLPRAPFPQSQPHGHLSPFWPFLQCAYHGHLFAICIPRAPFPNPLTPSTFPKGARGKRIAKKVPVVGVLGRAFLQRCSWGAYWPGNHSHTGTFQKVLVVCITQNTVIAGILVLEKGARGMHIEEKVPVVCILALYPQSQ